MEASKASAEAWLRVSLGAPLPTECSVAAEAAVTKAAVTKAATTKAAAEAWLSLRLWHGTGHGNKDSHEGGGENLQQPD